MTRLSDTLAQIQRWDVRVCMSFNRMIHVRLLLQLFRAVSWLGNGIFWYALMLALLLADPAGAFAPVLHMACAGLACTLTYKLLKRGTLRPRPFQVHRRIAAGAQPLDQFSFPSGHTLHAVAFTLVACSYYPQLAILTVPFTLLTAASRMVLGLHYPSDVLAGGALGALVALASFSL
ncbi:MAG: phosphatase PAP2 family protein [Proteobacteria bacterium]|nr:phosphatase PAP2 family protein [Pseudomonadota bacterium]